jgi:ribonuclease T1
MSFLEKLKSAFAGFVFCGVMALAGSLGAVPAFASLTVAVAELPRQGVQTYQLIRQGGPFPHQKDGVVFSNRERLLPAKTRGYYREYTVKTPSSRSRGVRRIVCGSQTGTPEACYYSDDHYASFRKIVP